MNDVGKVLQDISRGFSVQLINGSVSLDPHSVDLTRGLWCALLRQFYMLKRVFRRGEVGADSPGGSLGLHPMAS